MTPELTTRAPRWTARRRRTALLSVALAVLLTDLAVVAVGAVGGHPSRRPPIVGTAAATPSTTVTDSPISASDPTTTVTTAAPRATTPTSTTGTVPGPSGSGTTAPATNPPTGPSQCPEGACVTLDATTPIEAVNHAGSGFNLLPGSAAGANQMSVLGATMYRSTPATNGPTTSFDHLNWSDWDAAVQAGAQTTLVLSDLWAEAHPNRPPPTPWSDWSTYNQWVVDTVRGILQGGQTVDYWDVYNEPGWNSYYSQADFNSETPQDLLSQFLATYDDIKAVDPSARITGPSFGDTAFSPHPTNYWLTREPDMPQFLDFAAAHHLQLAAVAWHNNGQPPSVVYSLAEQTWALIRSLPALGSPKMFLDEYGDKENQPIPGWDVGYLAAITNAGISYATRSCWDGCQSTTLDGLLLDGGSAMTSEYFDRVTYAHMSGSMIQATSTTTQVPALGSLSSSGQQVTALIGRMSGCAVESWCDSAWFPTSAQPAPAMSVGVSVVLPWSTPTANIDLSYEPFEPGTAFSRPITTSADDPSLHSDGAHEVLSFVIPSFADGSAYNLTVTRG